MKVTGIRVGDLVQVRKPDKLFLAEVTSTGSGDLGIRPIFHNPRFPNDCRSASSREVIRHWRKSRG